MSELAKKDPVLSIRDIDITFGRGRKAFTAVQGASFDIFEGETVSLVGESGSGKTTIGRAIVRINPLSHGSIIFKNRLINGKVSAEEAAHYTEKLKEELEVAKKEFDDTFKGVSLQAIKDEYKAKIDALENSGSADKDERIQVLNKELREKVHQYNELDRHIKDCEGAIATYKTQKLSLAQRRNVVRKIQMIFQDPAASLNERATIEYIISEGLYNFHLYDDEKDRIQKVENIIKEVCLLPEHLTRYPHEFSGGQRQRVGLARSVVMEPEFIVADEPISALDVSIRAQVLNLLKKFQEERKLTYLFIAHDLSIVRFISDRIVVIHLGKIVEIAETEELFKYPLHPYTKSLMSAIPIPDPILEKEKTLFVYDREKMHDYSEDKPELVEIVPGHFVYANKKEAEEYRKKRGV